MPLRYTPVGGAAALPHLFKYSKSPIIVPHHHRFFTTSQRFLSDDSSSNHDHYETLEVRPNATQAEIKKSYFRLSKLHHPDTSTSKSSQNKFHLLSEAYAVLSKAHSRAAYDRTRPKYHHSHSASATNNPAGGRPPSGLSRRRSSFYGPPPSFYRSGGYGSHSSKRHQAHESSTAQSGSPEGTTTQEQTFYSRERPGMGYGEGHQETFGQRMPHFDSVAHERTHRRHEQRRMKRMEEKMGMNPDFLVSNNSGWVASFAVVSGCLVAAIMGGVMLGGL
ncbi:DnaJ subfamily A member 3, mitochondrial, partial [Cladorrhinum sp. PSN259]